MGYRLPNHRQRACLLEGADVAPRRWSRAPGRPSARP